MDGHPACIMGAVATKVLLGFMYGYSNRMNIVWKGTFENVVPADIPPMVCGAGSNDVNVVGCPFISTGLPVMDTVPVPYRDSAAAVPALAHTNRATPPDHWYFNTFPSSEGPTVFSAKVGNHSPFTVTFPFSLVIAMLPPYPVPPTRYRDVFFI